MNPNEIVTVEIKQKVKMVRKLSVGIDVFGNGDLVFFPKSEVPELDDVKVGDFIDSLDMPLWLALDRNLHCEED